MAYSNDTGSQPTERLVWSWSGLIFALLVGITVGLVLGSIFFNHLSWIASQFGFAGGWELVFALVMGVLGGVVSGVAGFAATLGGLVHASDRPPMRKAV